MTKFIKFDENNIIETRYDTDIHSTIPNGAVQVTDELFWKSINEQDGVWSFVNNEVVKLPFPAPTFEETALLFEQAVQNELELDAKAKGYDNLISACSYAASANPFQAEGKLFVTRRGNAWAYCYAELEKVQNGTRPIPTIETFILELPPRVS